VARPRVEAPAGSRSDKKQRHPLSLNEKCRLAVFSCDAILNFGLYPHGAISCRDATRPPSGTAGPPESRPMNPNAVSL
jgi:hypothetical protein